MSLSVVIVLVGTTHPGNVGAAARAMKTMGFLDLRLVDACDHLDPEAVARASGAHDVLERAITYPSLAEAIADCRTVVGTSARRREISVPILAAREIGELLAELAARTASAGGATGQGVSGQGVAGQGESAWTAPAEAACAEVGSARTAPAPAADEKAEPGEAGRSELRTCAAILFGQERSGLDNAALDLCTHQLRIPCNPQFSSLNLGSAVQVVTYELSQALASVPNEPPEGPLKADQLPATSAEMAHFFEHLDRIMIATGFLDPERPRQLRRRVRRYFERSRPSVNELAILRGVLSASEGARRRPGER